MAERLDWWLTMTAYKFLPNDMAKLDELTTMISNVVAFLLASFLVLYVARCLISIIWPVIIVVSAVFLIRLLRVFEPTDFVDMFLEAIELIMDMTCDIINKLWQYVLTYESELQNEYGLVYALV